MKTIIGSVAVILFAVFFDHARLAAEETQSSEMRFYPPRSIEWKPGPAAIPAGAKMAVLEGDPTKEDPFVVRFQFPDGYHIAPHTHPKTERVTVISGNLYLAPGEHAAWSEGETVIQLHWIGPWQINYVNPADDPRNAKNNG